MDLFCNSISSFFVLKHSEADICGLLGFELSVSFRRLRGHAGKFLLCL